MKWSVILAKRAVKDINKLKRAGLAKQAKNILEKLSDNPFYNPPSYEKLVGNLQGFYSRRINIKHRVVYSVDKDKKTIHVLRTEN